METNFNAEPHRAVISEIDQVVNRLTELGLELPNLLDAASRGLAARFSCTANHPPLASGFYAWAETVRGLRDIHMPLGWTRNDVGLLSLLESPDGKIAIAVATGDEGTGDPNAVPCTKSSKGKMTRMAVEENQLQLHLFDNQEALETPEQIRVAESHSTYWLLIHADWRTSAFRCELSRPIYMGVDNKLAGWEERIILGEIPFDEDPAKSNFDQGNNGPESGVYDDIEVKRRA